MRFVLFLFLCLISSLTHGWRLSRVSIQWNHNALKASTSDGSAFSQESGQIFVCTNRWCSEKGSDATIATLTFLTPDNIPVVGVNCLGRCNRGPNARVLTSNGTFLESSMLRSVESVVDLLQKNLQLNVNATAAEVLRLNYEGNVYLKNGEVDLAIEMYNKALKLGDKEQEGVLLVMRGTALLQRAYAYRLRHKDVYQIAEQVLPSYYAISEILEGIAIKTSIDLPNKIIMTRELLKRVDKVYKNLDFSSKWSDTKSKWPVSTEGPVVETSDELISKVGLSWHLYEYALLGALEDLLKATMILPGFAQAWRRAGDALSELRLFHTAIEYYGVAVQLDEALGDILLPAIERLRFTKQLVDHAQTQGLPIETILGLIET